MSRILEGEVRSGLGEGAKYVKMPMYNLLLTELLDEVPYPGTLNLHIGEVFEKFSEECPPSHIKSVIIDGEEKGGFYYWFGDLLTEGGPIPVLVVRPFLSRHPPDVIEVIAGKNLRETLNLRDGEKVRIKIFCSDTQTQR